MLTVTTGHMKRTAQKPSPVTGGTSPRVGLSLRRNFSWTFFGNVTYAVCQWGVLVVLAKLGSPEMVGQYALGLAVAAPVFMLTNLQLRGVQATDVRNEFSFVDYRSLRFGATVVGLLLVAGITVVSGYDRSTMLVVLFLGLAKGFESLSDVYFGFAQRHERMDLIARSMIYKGVLSFAAMVVLMYATHSIIWASAGVAAAWMLRFLSYDIRLASMLPEAGETKGWDWSRSGALLKVSLPLGLVMMLTSLNTNIPRYFIQHELGERALGFYSAISYLLVAGTTIVSALGQSASPRLAQYFANGDAGAFKRLLGKLVLIATGLGLAGIVVSVEAGAPLLSLIYTEDYASYAGLLTLIMIAALMQYTASFAGYGMTAARYFRVQLPLFLVVVSVMLVASFVLIPRYGLAGAATAVILASMANLVGAAGINYRALRSLPRNEG